MAINSEYFTNWQDGRQPSVMYSKTAPALVAIREYLLKRWGGQNLGGYGIRPVRGGSVWSSHAFGAAIDWRWASAGIDAATLNARRAVLDIEVLPFLIDNSLELGIQGIHDYYGKPTGTGRVWRSKRVNESHGWKEQADASTGMGQPWAQWLHIEVYESAWANGDPVENKLVIKPPTPVPAVVVPIAPLRIGATGAEVRKLQQILSFWGWGKKPFKIDGEFGAVTEIAVKQMQRALKVTIDGYYGPKTAETLRAFLVRMANVSASR